MILNIFNRFRCCQYENYLSMSTQTYENVNKIASIANEITKENVVVVFFKEI